MRRPIQPPHCLGVSWPSRCDIRPTIKTVRRLYLRASGLPGSYTGNVDVLSDAVVAVRTGRPHSTRHELYAPWGMRFPSGEGAGFHIVLRGCIGLLPSTP